jgi:hypothetical protein
MEPMTSNDPAATGPDEPEAVEAVPDDEDAGDAEELARLAAPARPVRRDVDPEDWQRSGGSEDDRYLRERPPHW